MCARCREGFLDTAGCRCQPETTHDPHRRWPTAVPKLLEQNPFRIRCSRDPVGHLQTARAPRIRLAGDRKKYRKCRSRHFSAGALHKRTFSAEVPDQKPLGIVWKSNERLATGTGFQGLWLHFAVGLPPERPVHSEKHPLSVPSVFMHGTNHSCEQAQDLCDPRALLHAAYLNASCAHRPGHCGEKSCPATSAPEQQPLDVSALIAQCTGCRICEPAPDSFGSQICRSESTHS